jgi:hypothetical protein
VYDETVHEAMRTFRKHFITVHYYSFYVLRRPVESAAELGSSVIIPTAMTRIG